MMIYMPITSEAMIGVADLFASICCMLALLAYNLRNHGQD